VWHRSAAAVYGIGHLPADTHEFTLPVDARPAGPPSRIAADLLREHEDPEAVALIVIEAIRKNLDDPAAFVMALTPYALRLGFRRDDGLAVLTWLFDLTHGRGRTMVGRNASRYNAPKARRRMTQHQHPRHRPLQPDHQRRRRWRRAAPQLMYGVCPANGV
jgi:hypothetical protein